MKTRVLLLALVAALAGCAGEEQPGDPDTAPAGSAGAASVAVPVGDLRTALLDGEYRGIFDEPVRLTDGLYEGPPPVPGAASRPTLRLLEDLTGMGDMDGDGRAEVAAVLARTDGGSGTFLYLALLRPEGRELTNVETLLLGDRTQVSHLEIREGSLVLTLLTHGPEDPACCPTREIRRTWRLSEGALGEIRLVRGHLVYSDDAPDLISCGGDEVFRVLDDTGGDLPEIVGNLAVAPDEPLFVEVRGLVIREEEAGPNRTGEPRFRVQEVLRALREGPGCSENLEGVDFRAVGVEPFWTLDVTPESLELRAPGAPTRTFGTETRWEAVGSLLLTGQAEDGGELSVEIREERCVDAMSGSVFPLRALVMVEGDTLRGCAVARFPR